MTRKELSPSGNPIYYHEAKDRPFQPATGDVATIDLITDHVEKHIGPVHNVYHEIVSDRVHLDILFVAPTKERNYYTLVTCGMSDLPMTVPEGAEAFRYAELMLCLPADWRFSDEAFRDENHYWPLRCLKTIARLPHEYDTWLYAAHTIPNGDPAEPYADNTKLAGMILSIPTAAEPQDEFFTLTSPEKEVHFFSLIPLYPEEMDYKLRHGADELFEKLNKIGVTELLDAKRKNTCKKRFGLF
ncbi:suppressor of fused domain protein [Cohnella suwonensis]|uniref:Suppressor of fused domain protein n=1 Tax=Cohnella suwonensis TaxID=696072 RepID=A0ABW0LQR9_9BACL